LRKTKPHEKPLVGQAEVAGRFGEAQAGYKNSNRSANQMPPGLEPRALLRALAPGRRQKDERCWLIFWVALLPASRLDHSRTSFGRLLGNNWL
jgi:hypothetical protein